jgi:hypothetical protein
LKLAFRYVKLHVRDLKRKIKTILQINDRNSTTAERSASRKSQTPMTPTIIIQHAYERRGSASEHNSKAASSDKTDFFSNDVNSDSNDQTLNCARASRCFNENFESSVQNIESSINKYFQVVTLSAAFDLSKIIDVKIILQIFICLSK